MVSRLSAPARTEEKTRAHVFCFVRAPSSTPDGRTSSPPTAAQPHNVRKRALSARCSRVHASPLPQTCTLHHPQTAHNATRECRTCNTLRHTCVTCMSSRGAKRASEYLSRPVRSKGPPGERALHQPAQRAGSVECRRPRKGQQQTAPRVHAQSLKLQRFPRPPPLDVCASLKAPSGTALGHRRCPRGQHQGPARVWPHGRIPHRGESHP